MPKKRKWILITVACIASVFILIIVGANILILNQYRASAGSIYPPPDHPQISITSPSQSSQFSLGAPIIIQATAFDTQGVSAIELYIDGEYSGVESAPAGGSENFPAEFLWSPPAAGVYSLIAYAKGIDQQTTYSSPIQIMITSAKFDPEAQDTTDYASSAPKGFNPHPAQPGPEDTPGSAQSWQGTLGNWITSFVADIPPHAPELAATVEGCSIKLSIHDLSNNEEGFEIWRLLPNSPSWSRVDVLSSQTQDEWITYSDNMAHGGTTYYASAFNSKGSQDSNLVHVNIDPADCLPTSNERTILTLKLESLQTQIPTDKLYCYFSLDGVHWMRRPEFGFWPGEDVLQQQGSFNSEIISLTLPGEGSRDSETNPKTLYLQCWGWEGNSLRYLGEISPSPIPNQPGTYQFGTSDLVAAVNLNQANIPDMPEFFPMEESWDYGYELGVFEDEIMKINGLSSLLSNQVIDSTMPFVSAMLTYSPENCKNHLPPPFQNLPGQILFCYPFPGFDSGWEGANPQPYLVWGPNQVPMCIDGQGPVCKSYEDLLSQAADLGHEFGFNVFDINNKSYTRLQFTAPELFSYVIPPIPCSGPRELWVQMWYYDGSSLLPTYGPPSNIISMDCPYQLGQQMLLDIRFDEILFSNLDDGESPPQKVEVYGYLRANSESMTRYLNLAHWYGLPLPQTGFSGYPKTFANGISSLGDINLCESNSYLTCSESGWETNNNNLRVIIEGGDSLTLSVKIIDIDFGSFHDLVCEGTFQIPGQSIFDWHKIDNQKFGITGSTNGSGYCQIKGVMNAVSP